MSVFIVKIGRPTRKGMEVLITRYIKTEMHQYTLREKLNNIYKGLGISIEQPEEWEELIEDKPKEPDPIAELKPELPKLQKIYSLRDKAIEITEDEKLLYQVYIDAVKNTRMARDKLRGAICTRLKKLSWISNIYEHKIKLNTDRIEKTVIIEEILLKDEIIEIYENDIGISKDIENE